MTGTMTNRVDRPTAAVDAALSDLLQAEKALLTGLDDAHRDQLIAALRQLLAPHASDQPAGVRR